MYVIKGMKALNAVRDDILFTSDQLFYDEDILYERQSWTVEQMNDYLIQKWNSVVKRNDIVFHLGNFSVGSIPLTKSILQKLNGNINLIIGTSDTHDTILECKDKLMSISYKLDIFINDISITLNHHPQLNWNRKNEGAWMLHGSTFHNQPLLINEKLLDVGVDGYDGEPISFEKIYSIMDRKEKYIYNQQKLTQKTL